MLTALVHVKPARVLPRRTTIEPPPLIYIAAPFTRPNPLANTHAVIQIADALLVEAGFTPLVPHLRWPMTAPG